MNLKQLKAELKGLGVKGYSTLKKNDLEVLLMYHSPSRQAEAHEKEFMAIHAKEQRKKRNDKAMKQRLLDKGAVVAAEGVGDKNIEKVFLKLLANVKDKDMMYVQLTVAGEPVVHRMITFEGKDAVSIYWNNLHRLLWPRGTDNTEPSVVHDQPWKIALFKQKEVPTQRYQQIFREGDINCAVKPLREFYEKSMENAKTDSTKKKMKQMIRRLNEFEEAHPDGVSEEEMNALGKLIGRKLVVHGLMGDIQYVFNHEAKASTHYTNTRLNHVDESYLILQSAPTIVDEDTLYTIIQEHDRDGIEYIYRGDKTKDKPVYIGSTRGSFAVESEDKKVFHRMDDLIHKNTIGIRYHDYPVLCELLKDAYRVCAAPLALGYNPNELDNTKLLDLKKAYTQHKYAPGYVGFLGYIQQWRNLRHMPLSFISGRVGIYQIEMVKTTDFYLKFGLRSGEIYTLTSPEIEYFKKEGCLMSLLAGCWGSTFDMEYPEEMLENRRYAHWAGRLAMVRDATSTYTLGGHKYDYEWVSHLKSEYGEENVYHWDNLTKIRVENPRARCHHHVAAFITAYTRLNMFELMKHIDGELVKIVLDGIYYRGTFNEYDSPPLNRENVLKEHASFTKGWYEPSSIRTVEWPSYNRTFDGSVVLRGAGGTGKSHAVFSDKGLINVLRVVPTHELGRMVEIESDESDDYHDQIKRYTTIHRLIGTTGEKDCQTWKDKYHGQPNVIFIDELTMIPKDWIEKAIKLYPQSMFIIAGDVSETQWFQCRSGRPGLFSPIWLGEGWRSVEFKTDYRARNSPELMKMKEFIREKMREVFTDGDLDDTIKISRIVEFYYDTVDFDDAVKMFVAGDTWIAGTHRTNKLLMDAGVISGKDHEGHDRGSFTTHAFQGKTIHTGKVFVSLDCFEYAMLYTAISRCVSMEQLVLVRRK